MSEFWKNNRWKGIGRDANAVDDDWKRSPRDLIKIRFSSLCLEKANVINFAIFRGGAQAKLIKDRLRRSLQEVRNATISYIEYTLLKLLAFGDRIFNQAAIQFYRVNILPTSRYARDSRRNELSLFLIMSVKNERDSILAESATRNTAWRVRSREKWSDDGWSISRPLRIDYQMRRHHRTGGEIP